MPEHEITGEFEAKKLFTERLYKELHTVQQFRFRFSAMKIAFVTGLLGIGAMNLKIGHNIDLSPALLLAPLVAVLFDILGMTATVAISRIDAFLRLNGTLEERAWQSFQEKHPLSVYQDPPKWSFHLSAANGFTLITFLVSFMFLLYPKLESALTIPNCPLVCSLLGLAVWFSLIALLWCGFRCMESKVKHNFKKMER